jgi:hypothetical protein
MHVVNYFYFYFGSSESVLCLSFEVDHNGTRAADCFYYRLNIMR